MLNARLDYVEEVRDRIQMAQEYFYWFQRAQDRRDLAEATIRSYQRLLDTDRARQNPSDAAQIRDAIQSAQSNLVDAVGDINTYRISLMDQIGLETLEIDQIDNVTLIADDYYGKGYLAASREELTESAVANDAEIRVLENALENALLKRRLAEQGKWDIFGSVFGRQDLRGEGNPSDPYGYEVGVGLNVKLNDPKLLKLSTQRADADASKFKAEITRRSQQVRNLIDRRLVSAISQRAQLDANKASVISREAVFQQKVADYIDGRDTIDNLINAQVNLFQTQRNTIDSARFFFEEITELDQLTGVYFTVLGIKIEVGAELDDM